MRQEKTPREGSVLQGEPSPELPDREGSGVMDRNSPSCDLGALEFILREFLFGYYSYKNNSKEAGGDTW